MLAHTDTPLPALIPYVPHNAVTALFHLALKKNRRASTLSLATGESPAVS